MGREPVKNSPALLNVVPGIGTKGVHHLRELVSIPDEEYLQTGTKSQANIKLVETILDTDFVCVTFLQRV